MVKIRRADSDDSHTISRLIREAFGPFEKDYTPGGFEYTTPDADAIRLRFEQGPIWIAELDGEPVGTVSGMPDAGRFYIRSMAIKPTVQRAGIGQRLLDTLETYARDNGFEKLFLYTTLVLPGAKRLYEKNGFYVLRETQPEEWHDMGGYEMEKLVSAELMIGEIKNELRRLQEDSDIKILLAVESGSRAWGFASTDSDWDVRYIYIHRLDWYLRIDQHKDSQETILPNDIDLAGWELRKALGLFRKSNPPLLEWLRSPIVYLEQFSTANRLRELSEQYFNPRSCMYHYLSMAKGNFNEFLKDRDRVKIKKYFYVLRPVLACDWIRNRSSFPPMEFDKLVEDQVKDTEVRSAIATLLERKIAGEELNEEPRVDVLNEFLAEKIAFYNEHVGEVDTVDRPQTEMLDELFRRTLTEVWN